MATLNLPQGVRSAVWQLLKARLQADPVLQQARVNLLFLDGDPASLAALESFSDEPAVRFAPSLGQMAWFDEGSVAGALVVTAEALLPRADADDHMNLQEALEAALNAVGDAGFGRSLADAGAETGLVLFADPLNPAPGQDGQDNVLRLQGRFAVEVRRPLLP